MVIVPLLQFPIETLPADLRIDAFPSASTPRTIISPEPSPPLLPPTLTLLAVTKAQSAMLSEPTPRSPTVKERTLFQCEPVPLTRASPLLPAHWPTLPFVLPTIPPESIVSGAMPCPPFSHGT